MILSITLSKPTKECSDILGATYTKIRIWRKPENALLKSKKCYDAEFFTDKQSFRKTFSEDELNKFMEDNSGKSFKNIVKRTETEEITILTNRHGETTTLTKSLKGSETKTNFQNRADKTKNYIIKEGTPVPFLIKLGVMTKEGKIIAAKYDKFRQINRFLEYINDILPEVTKSITEDKGFSEERPLRIADFGCGKSYLTFAVYHFLKELKGIPVEITGLDLKEDVIRNCQSLSNEFNYKNLNFFVGNIADFSYKNPPDIIITLHACDTATDYALHYAICQNATAILSVPCCQHELNLQMQKPDYEMQNDNPFSSICKFGILRERMAALATDALRAELLEQSGYKVQVLEFIDMSHTPKNLLIRAVKRDRTRNEKDFEKLKTQSKTRTESLMKALSITQELNTLLKE